ncbi:MAG: hypothetical protein AB2L18_06755 [Anaerolineaceae bacterium]
MGSSLPEQAQRALIKSKLKAGCLIHYFCDFTKPPKNKFIVIVHVDFRENLLLCFIVNSEINAFLQSKPELKNRQVELEQSKYKFLNHDSYINCSEVIDEIDIDNVIDHLVQEPGDYKCMLIDTEMQEIIQVVNGSTTITDNDQKLIINSLGN